MSETIQIKLSRRDGAVERRWLEILPPGELVLHRDETVQPRYRGKDLFDALMHMRMALSDSGETILCHGARRDVYPSGMSRSMGHGRKAYALTLGEAARGSDLLDIFDEAELETIASPEEQKRFHDDWVASLRNKPGMSPTLPSEPTAEEHAQATSNPDGWVYRIEGQFGAGDTVPPDTIIGAWKVDESGVIVGAFIANPNFRSKR